MKIGIFGGSFNPPHKMHLNIVEELLNEKILDKVIIVPTGLHYSYKNNLASNEHIVQTDSLYSFSPLGVEVKDKVIGRKIKYDKEKKYEYNIRKNCPVLENVKIVHCTLGEYQEYLREKKELLKNRNGKAEFH